MADSGTKKLELFVSYSRDDRDIVYPEVDWLRSLGFEILIDRHITPGVQWRGAVADAIAESDVLLFYVSHSSIASQFCAQEVQYALNHGIPVITVLLVATSLPPWMELALGDQQILERFDLDSRAYRILLETGLRKALGSAAPMTPPRVIPAPRARNRRAPILVISGMAALILALAAGWYLRQTPSPSIAAMPFDTDGSGEALAMSAGIAAELAQGLSDLNILPVRTAVSPSVHGADSAPPDPTEIGASHLLIGSVRHAAGGYRIRTALVAADSARELWAQAFSYPADSPLDVQRAHVRNVLQALPDVLAGTIPSLDRSTPERRRSAAERYRQGAETLALPVEGQDLARARRLFEQALNDFPGYLEPLLGLCELFLRRYDESREVQLLAAAETRCLQALAIGRETHAVHLALGRVFLLRGDTELARTHFQRAATITPDDAAAWAGLGAVAEQRRDHALALEYYDRAIQQPNADWQAHFAIGNHHFARGNYAAAAEHYQIVVTLYPQSPAAYTNLGAARYNLGEFDEAVDAWRHAIELEPTAMSWANLGAAHTYLEAYDDAAAAYRRAVEMAPADHRWRGHLAEVEYYGLDVDPEAVKQNLQRALELALAGAEYVRGDAGTLARVSTYEALLGRREEALSHAASARAADPEDLQAAYSILQTYTALGEVALASRERQRLLGLGYPELLLNRDPWLR